MELHDILSIIVAENGPGDEVNLAGTMMNI
jgi:hypothetical protein